VLWEQVGLPRVLGRLKPALFHAPNCFLPLRRPCPGVVTIHDLAFERYPEDFSRRTGAKYRFFTPRAARSAERVICVSRYTADDVVARYGVDERKIRVIPNAAALALGDAPPPPGPYLVAVGDLRAKKNLGRLIEAWQRAQLPHRLVLAGLGTMDVPDGVELTGYVDDSRLDALMRGADLVVHPSLYEGFGLVVLEAMARGTPVAAARATALPETAGDAAVLFDPLDVDDMAAAIGRALRERDDLARRGRERAAQFSWEATARATADVYRELL
jgi:glycosyltransferase involved in cell wall biosynthesis